MVASWLTADIQGIFTKNPHARVVLWFDKENEFGRLLDDGVLDGAPFTLLRHQVDPDRDTHHGTFWLKAQIEWETRSLPADERDEERFVVYLPLDRAVFENPQTEADHALECLLEYKYSGKLWLIDGYPPTLFTWLKSHGVPLPTTRAEQQELWEDGADSLLARFVTHHRERNEAFWEEPLDAARCQDELLGNTDDELLAFMAGPASAVRRLKAEEKLDAFASVVESEFGYTADPEADPEGWSKAFLARLVMTECFVGYDCPDDFPFASIVAPENLRTRHLGFLKRWMDSQDHSGLLAERLGPVEREYDVRTWAADRDGTCEALYCLARGHWDSFYDGLTTAAEKRSTAAEYLNANGDLIDSEQKRFWARQEDALPGWRLAGMLAKLVALADAACAESDGLSEPAAFVRRYAESWHQVDRLYLELCAALASTAGLEAIGEVAGREYCHYLEQVNGSFRQCLDALDEWGDWADLSVLSQADGLWRGHGRRAVLVIDALRYDLAARLAESLRASEPTLEPWVAAIPPITSVGMTALLPIDASDVSAVVAKGKLELIHAKYGDLAVKSNRIKLLKAAVKGMHSMNLDELTEMTTAPDGSGTLVVFDRETDEIGHAVGSGLSKHIAPLLAALRTALSKLQAWGYSEIHIVTDHGFLTYPGGAKKDELPADAAIIKDKRYAFLKEDATSARKTLSFPLDDRLRLAFAAGVRSFTEGQEFLHGGLSLQELVVPHVAIHLATPLQKMTVKLVEYPAEVAGNPVQLRVATYLPEADEKSLFSEEAQPRRVLIDLRRDAGDPESSVCMNARTLELGPDKADTIEKVTLFLNADKHLVAGETVHVYIHDADNEAEDLAPGASFTLTEDI